MGNVELPLPVDVTTAFRRLTPAECHPGLLLDKYTWRPDRRSQEQQKKDLDAVCQAVADRGMFREAAARRERALEALGAVRWEQKTAGPLTLHLARTSPLENAGIALHPIYGFLYLPGTGLKGMAHAWAETIWAPGQPDPQGARKAVQRIFGWAPDGADDGGAGGAVIFHDAWPAADTKLFVDILNSHHAKYYQQKQPPVEWDDPIPVYFLAIGRDTPFQFAVSGTARAGAGDLEQAAGWLMNALVHLGAGAKTSAGYGRFRPAPGRSRVKQLGARIACEYTIRIDTPAFLAGAAPDGSDCSLRSATLRGQLRYWWRTMHAARLSTEDLLKLESAIWGDTNRSAAVSLEVEALGPENGQTFDPNQIAQTSCIPRPQGRQTYGFRYTAYGMQEKHRRWLAGVPYRIRFSARAQGDLTAADALSQAELSLKLLCHFGGVGSKSRNGYGGLTLAGDVQDDDALVRKALEDARLLRGRLGYRESAAFPPRSPSLEQVIRWSDDLPQRDFWQALDMVGSAYRNIASAWKRDRKKVGLGLPRKIGKDRDVLHLRHAKGGNRHPSPMHFTLRQTDAGFRVRFTAFPSDVLPDFQTNAKLMADLLAGFRNELGVLKPRRPVAPGTTVSAPPPVPKPVPTPGTGLQVKQRVTGTLADKTKKGKWRAEVDGVRGPIHNSNDIPADLQEGATVTLVVTIATPNPAFRYVPEGK